MTDRIAGPGCMKSVQLLRNQLQIGQRLPMPSLYKPTHKELVIPSMIIYSDSVYLIKFKESLTTPDVSPIAGKQAAGRLL